MNSNPYWNRRSHTRLNHLVNSIANVYANELLVLHVLVNYTANVSLWNAALILIVLTELYDHKLLLIDDISSPVVSNNSPNW